MNRLSLNKFRKEKNLDNSEVQIYLTKSHNFIVDLKS